MPKATNRFLQNEALTLSVTGALARGTPVYRKGTSPKEREEVRDHIKCLLPSIAGRYEITVGEEDHLERIEYISEEISKSHQNKLYVLPPCTEGRFRIGRAQKALNLYLKYLWAFGWIPPPPHCPFDSVVLRELTLPKKHDIPWTKMDDVGVYHTWIEAAKREAKTCGLCLPRWEVETWNNFV